MNLSRPARSLFAWLLYFSVLFGALACSIGHGQMAGLQLSGMYGGHCFGDGATQSVDLAGDHLPLVNADTGSGCMLSSTFSGLALAALFGLLGLLPLARSLPLPTALFFRPPVRYLWPSANPRASPAF